LRPRAQDPRLPEWRKIADELAVISRAHYRALVSTVNGIAAGIQNTG